MIAKTEIVDVTKRGAKTVGPHTPGEDRLFTIKEVSELTGLAVGTLYHFVSQKRIPVVRLSRRCIRFRKSDMSDWIQTLTQETR